MPRLLAAVFAAACALTSAAAAAEPAAPPPLSKIADLRQLSRDQAAEHRAVRVRGVVTFKWREGMESFGIQDASAGIWVTASMALSTKYWAGDDALLHGLREGMEVEVDGATEAGGFGPNIMPKRLTVIGEGALPPAAAVPLARLMSGAEDAQRVEVTGIVQRCGEPRSGTWLLQVDTGGGRLLAHVPISAVKDPARLVDAEVRLRGVADTSRNWRAEFICPRLLVAADNDVEMVAEAPADPFAVPAVAFGALATFSPSGRALHRRRVTGTVTYCEPGKLLYLQEGTRALRVEIAEGAPALRLGDHVEVSGFIDTTAAVAGISDALVRVIAAGSPPAPVATTLADIVAAFLPVRRMGRPASPHDYDGLLVSVTGRLLSMQHDEVEGRRRLVLDCGGALTIAELGPAIGAERSGAERIDDLRLGSLLRVSGVAEVRYASANLVADYVEPQRLDVLLRDADDVVALEAPSWWTPQRLAVALGGTGALLLGTLMWTFAMRRLLGLRTQRLEEVMRTHRDTELEFKAAQHERQRLAADMHDGLQQLIAGAAFRLEAAVAHMAEIPPTVQAQFTAARGALLRTQEGLRDCLWGLRHVEEGPGEFAALLEHAAASMDHWPRGAVTVRVEGAPFALSRHVMGSLLMLMQEAVGNAFRHGHAKKIDLLLAYDAEALAMRIDDDGGGFDPQAAPGTGRGHFGLESMRHRMAWLGGSVEIASKPGAGASVRIHLPRSQAQAADVPSPAAGELSKPATP